MDSVKSIVARLVTVLATSTAVLLTATLPAAAHTYLESSEPGEGATVSEEITGIVLDFNQAVNQTIAAIEVTAPDGTSLGDGPVRIDEAVVQRAIAPPPVEGRYVVSWRIVASDGHPLKGRFAFRYEGPVPEPEPRAEPTRPGDTQGPAPDETSANGVEPAEETPTDTMAPGSVPSPAPMAGMADDTVQIAESGAPVPRGRLSLLSGVTLAVLLAAALAVRALRRWNPPIEHLSKNPPGSGDVRLLQPLVDAGLQAPALGAPPSRPPTRRARPAPQPVPAGGRRRAMMAPLGRGVCRRREAARPPMPVLRGYAALAPRCGSVLGLGAELECTGVVVDLYPRAFHAAATRGRPHRSTACSARGVTRRPDDSYAIDGRGSGGYRVLGQHTRQPLIREVRWKNGLSTAAATETPTARCIGSP